MKKKDASEQATEQLDRFRHELAAEIESHRKTKIKLQMREHENHAITKSRSYKLARALAGGMQGVRVGVDRAKSLNPKRVVLIHSNKRHVRDMYRQASFTDAFKEPRTADLVIIFHLYYTEMLPLFIERLKVLQSVGYDLYITLPEHRASDLEKVQEQLPAARIVVVPNCGRDVLPFVQTMKQIRDCGYSNILKLHTKKSPHRTDGESWRDRILDNLLPADKAILSSTLATLNRKTTALVGPAEEYVSLLVNFEATFGHLRRLVQTVCGDQPMKYVVRHPDEFGFFGGTMFWARVDALLPIIDAVTLEDFEPELGQEDSTLAHALERVFNVIPELQKKDLFEVDTRALKPRAYETTNIPAWAEYSIDG